MKEIVVSRDFPMSFDNTRIVIARHLAGDAEIIANPRKVNERRHLQRYLPIHPRVAAVLPPDDPAQSLAPSTENSFLRITRGSLQRITEHS